MTKRLKNTDTRQNDFVNASLAVTGMVHREKDDTYAYKYEGTDLSGATKSHLIAREASKIGLRP